MSNNTFDIKARIQKLTEDINKRNDNYFLDESTGKDDHIFDGIYAELKKLLEEHPEYDTPDSPIHRVGGRASNTFDEVEHKIPMLSLGKAMSLEEFKKWFVDMVSKGVKRFIFELKYDGLACSLLYIDGKLVRGATRGDGKIGEDISATVNLVPNVPKTISKQDLMEVRGEIMLLKSGLEIINQKKIAAGQKPYENVRNAASGLLRTKTPDKDVAKHLRFGPYMLAQFGDKSISHSQDLSDLAQEGFKFDNNTIKTFTIDVSDRKYYYLETALEEIKNFFDEVQKQRETLDFDIDGIVCKADLYTDQHKLGMKTNVPNWAIAYKFESDEKVTQLLDVEWLLGAKGDITPRAKITPTAIGGTTVKKPTLHNIDEIKRLGIKIGDYCVLQRRGDVIPKIDRVLTELRTGNEVDIVFPTTCPECGSILVGNGPKPRCENKDCTGRNFSKIRNYIISLEIENFGPALVEKLIDAEKLNDLVDIYSLVQDDLANLDKMGDKSAKKVIDNINKSKKAPLWKVIAGLTIKGIGGETAKDLAGKYETLSDFSNAKFEDLANMYGVGAVTANNIIDWLENEDNQKIIERLLDLGIGKLIDTEEVKAASDKLTGKKFGFTGDLDTMTRKEAEKVIVANGGVAHGLKKDTDLILIGKGFKQHKVDDVLRKNPNAKTVTEQEFLDMLK